jgi:hypothetical protein
LPQGLNKATALGAAIGQLHRALTQCESVEGFATFGDLDSAIVAVRGTARPVTGEVAHLNTIASTRTPPHFVPLMHFLRR